MLCLTTAAAFTGYLQNVPASKMSASRVTSVRCAMQSLLQPVVGSPSVPTLMPHLTSQCA